MLLKEIKSFLDLLSGNLILLFAILVTKFTFMLLIIINLFHQQVIVARLLNFLNYLHLKNIIIFQTQVPVVVT